MKIAVDAMGGDNAPGTIVEGAVLASKEFGVDILLVGDEGVLRDELSKYKDDNFAISIKHASEVILMNEAPSIALRKKRNSSIRVAIEAVKSGEAKAVVSAGNTGAVLAASSIILRTIKGVARPAIAVSLPTIRGTSILLDAGANVDCKAEQLFQFGIMGHVYAKYMLGKINPSIGLLSIGEEDTKGNEATKGAFQMLKKSSINFIGNVEGKETYKGNAEVLICDGFIGNVALKISESLAEMIEKSLKMMFAKNLRSKIAYMLIKPYLKAFKKSVDHNEYGGAPLLGINGICIISHGNSTSKAIKNAIRVAAEFVKKDVNAHIQQDIELNLEIQDSKQKKRKFWSHIKDSIPFPLEKGRDD
ncbi:MAG: phosphate acyltransferase PlsX [Nitrospinota bacterium]